MRIARYSLAVSIFGLMIGFFCSSIFAEDDILKTLKKNDNSPITIQVIKSTCQAAGKLVQFRDQHNQVVGFLSTVAEDGRIIGHVPKTTEYALFYHLDPGNKTSACEKRKDGSFAKQCKWSLSKVKGIFYLAACSPVIAEHGEPKEKDSKTKSPNKKAPTKKQPTKATSATQKENNN